MHIFEENSVLKDSQGAPYTFQWNPNNSGTHIKQNIVNVLDIIRYEFHEKKIKLSLEYITSSIRSNNRTTNYKKKAQYKKMCMCISLSKHCTIRTF